MEFWCMSKGSLSTGVEKSAILVWSSGLPNMPGAALFISRNILNIHISKTVRPKENLCEAKLQITLICTICVKETICIMQTQEYELFKFQPSRWF